MGTSVNNIHSLIAGSDENRDLIQKNDKCDKYDYLAVVACGVIGSFEKKFKVNYDHRHSADVDNLFNMSTKIII